VAHGHAGRLQGGPAAPAESAHSSRCALGVRATAGARGAMALGGDLDGGGGGDSALTSGEEEEAALGSEDQTTAKVMPWWRSTALTRLALGRSVR
jgi:hypothetical protein